MDIQYIGEHLGPGKLGHFFIITSFIAALFSAFSYYRAANTEATDPNGSMFWVLLGRNGFVIHTAAVISIFVTLFYLITNHYFEYFYVWKHSDLSLSPKYLLSCFWEGQEGSFLLWSFWHGVLGIIVMLTAKKMESRTMTVISLVQVALATMVLGFYFGQDVNIGSSPFILLREKMAGAPIFNQANYMEFFTDGKGLNILLQNYWMVIHPPVLFLGFASTLIPFAYIIAALWKGEYKSFIKHTWVWSLFSGGILGLGIMMGGAWAYESLTFGGYWAWDPVENASLVPWLTLVAALHTLIIYKVTGRSFIITVILFVATYLLIWYSTFLTRTGILGDTSVHSFVGEGKSLYWHLLIVIFVLLIGSILLMIRRWKGLPRVKTEEHVSSREFWMFIGSFVLFLSAIQIIISTSIPVWSPLAKWITGKEVAPPIDPIAHYNSIQVWVAMVLAVLSAAILYLKFKKSDAKSVWKKLGLTGVIALALSLLIGFTQKIDAPQYALLLFAAFFAIVATIYYAVSIQKVKFKKLGAASTHLGFALALLGILLSSYNKDVISINTLGLVFNFGEDKMANVRESMQNVMLYKNVAMPMAEYDVTYVGDSTSEEDPRTFYKVLYQVRDKNSQEVTESFVLHPNAFLNPNGQEGSLSANPDSKHYLTRDIFTYVQSAVDPAKKYDTLEYKKHVVKQGDTVFLNRGFLVFAGFNTNVSQGRYNAQEGDIAVEAVLNLNNFTGTVDTLKPLYLIRDGLVQTVDDTVLSRKLYVQLANILPKTDAAELRIRQAGDDNDYIVMKAIVFPYINLLWLGIIIMVLGFMLAMYNRATKKM